MEYFVGLMSGTSLDGVDLVLAATRRDRPPELVDFYHQPFSDQVRSALLAWNQAAHWIPAEFIAINHALGQIFGEAVRDFVGRHKSLEIVAVGLHGITVQHCPEPMNSPLGPGSGTLQLGDPHLVAALCGLPVIFDFRHRDMALGGQGAPLAPFLDNLMFRHQTRGRILLNLGGIANLSFLDANQNDVFAFDTGPANMIVDSLMRRHPTDPGAFDPGGSFAARGKIIQPLLDHCLNHPYFSQKPPKSTGRELFGDYFTRLFLEFPGERSYNDLLATATRLTAQTVANGILNFHPGGFYQDLIISGGGAHNLTLMNHLRELCPQLELSTSSDHGLDSDAKEAMLMAVLAQAWWHRVPGNFPSVTGASGSVVLGACTR